MSSSQIGEVNMYAIRFLVFAWLLTWSTSTFAQEKPNVLLIFLDNFGWGEPGFNGGGIVRGAETPTLEEVPHQATCYRCGKRGARVQCVQGVVCE